MALDRCPKCGRMHYRTDPCGPAPAKSQTVPVLAGRSGLAEPASTEDAQRANTKSAPKSPGRPRIHEDRRAYKTQKQREYRARDKAKAKENTNG